MLTIFGKKKKEDDKKAATLTPEMSPGPINDQTEGTDEQSQESPFAKIFQSISQDYQKSTPPSRPEVTGAPPLSVTPDWVQPRELPRSKAMIIPKTRDDESGWEERKTKTSGQASTSPDTSQPSRPSSSPSHSIPSPAPSPVSERSESKSSPTSPSAAKSPGDRSQQTEKQAESAQSVFSEGSASIDSSGEYSFKGFDDLSKLLAETDSALAFGRENEKELEKPVKTEKPKKPEPERAEKTEVTEKKEPFTPKEKPSSDKGGRGFEHIFELTQGALETPGLAVIDGSPGTGKTSVCLGLVDRYLKQGSPCIFVTYGQTPATIRDGLKNLGCDAAQAESNYRFMIVDAFTAQSGGFSFELYSLMEPWDLAKLQDTLVGNCGMFFGEKVRVIIDPIDGLASKIGTKDFGKQFAGLMTKLKETGATVIFSCDLTGLGKDAKGWAEEEADCVVELDAEAGKTGKEYSLKVTSLKGNKTKNEGEEWELQAGKGLVFV